MSSFLETSSKHRILSSMGNVAVFFAAYVGLSVERISRETGVDPVSLMDPDAYLTENFYENFFNLLIKDFPERNVALELAQLAPLSYFGTPGRLLLRAPDAKTMLEMFVDNCDLLADRLKMEAVDGSSTETFLCASQPLDEIVNGVSQEIGLGLGVRVVRECFSEGLLAHVQFRHKARGPISAYEELFRVPVKFQAESNALVFKTKELDRLNRRGRPELRCSLEQRLQRFRQEIGLEQPDGIADIRRMAVCNAIRGDYSVSGLARSLGMSLSSLQRRMPSGVSACSLLGEIRYVNAMGMLTDNNLSIDEVAFRLGFESERGFRKAFRRWSGKSPSEARREMTQPDPPSIHS